MLAKVAFSLEFSVVFPQTVEDDFPKGQDADLKYSGLGVNFCASWTPAVVACGRRTIPDDRRIDLYEYTMPSIGGHELIVLSFSETRFQLRVSFGVIVVWNEVRPFPAGSVRESVVGERGPGRTCNLSWEVPCEVEIALPLCVCTLEMQVFLCDVLRVFC